MALSFRPRIFVTPPVEVAPPALVPDVTLPSQEFRDEFPLLSSPTESVFAPEVYINVTLKLPQSLYSDYQDIADAQEQPVEEVLESRLSQCKAHNAKRGLWFSDSDRAALEDMVQRRPVESAAQALRLLAQGGVFRLEVDEGQTLEISLTLAQRKALKFAMYKGCTPRKWIENLIRKELRT